jgi:tRNA (cmo5U34)-methyltransferase
VSDKKDQIYLHEQPDVDFVFDDKVTAVFSDMIKRSVPGYATIISMIGTLAERYAKPGTNCYDLGCSLGTATFALRHHISVPDVKIVSVDNSGAMIKQCREAIDRDEARVPVELICADLMDVEIENASIVILNFTVQFLPVALRTELMKRIHKGMVPGGLLLLSEKVSFSDEDLNELFIDMYHRFKKQNGYTEMEISRKRAALENVLVPETVEVHEARMAEAGFASFDVWFQCFNFASMVAIK